MNTRRYNNGIMYIFLGLVFFLVTLDIIFPYVMFLMKLVFYSIGTIVIIGGILEVKDSYKKK